MKQKKNKPKASEKRVIRTDTNAGVKWLNSLDEKAFRDDVLEHLFRKMKKAGAILAYQNIHGRNDKGVDYIVTEKTIFGSRILGIQAKSKPISRSEGNASLSSIRIKVECDAAMEHTFSYEKSQVRLDNIELWCSNHITEDAIQEFNASASKNKVQIQTEATIYSMVETYCSDLIQKVPECALALYLKDKQNPKPHAFKLLGRRLEPQKHFIEPEFSKTSPVSVDRLVTKNRNISPKSENIKVDQIILSDKNILLEGRSLSGKSYLLERMSWLIASAGNLPITITVDDIKDKRKQSIWHLAATALGFLNIGEVEAFAAETKIYVLIDNIDQLKDDHIKSILEEVPNIKVIGTTSRHVSSETASTIYLAGIKKESIPLFLRALDTEHENIKAFTDRAYAFITRSLEHSVSPLTPFTFSIMLGECDNTKLRFTTPTFGRLIQRFVEHQLGSVSELNMRVDFETKRAFLLKLSGEKPFSFTVTEFRKKLIKFIEHSSHPHAVSDFYLDLLDSGVFTFHENFGKISWSHPVIKQFFFVQNILKNERYDLILNKLIKHSDITFACLVGSQLGNASKIVEPLFQEVLKIPPIKESDILNLTRFIGLDLLPDENQENEMLERIENAESTLELVNKSTEETNKQEVKPSLLSPEKMRKAIEPHVRQFLEGRYFMAQNLAALLVNARDTRTDLKEKSVRRIIEVNASIGHIFIQMLKKIAPNLEAIDFFLGLFFSLFQFQVTDSHLGDPFLLPVFKKLALKPESNDEHLSILDLELGCGENVSEAIVKTLKKVNRLNVTVAVYHRVIMLYFFRFHREKDKRMLRQLLKDIRRTHKSINLPTPV